jgi:hypothetical protein
MFDKDEHMITQETHETRWRSGDHFAEFIGLPRSRTDSELKHKIDDHLYDPILFYIFYRSLALNRAPTVLYL